MKHLFILLVLLISGCASIEKFINDINKEGPKELEVTYDSISIGSQLGPKVCFELVNEDMNHLEKEFYKSKIVEILKSNNFVVSESKECTHILRALVGKEVTKQSRMVPILNYTPAKSFTAHSYGAYGSQTTTVTENGGGTLNVVGHREEVEYVNNNAAMFMAFDKKKIAELPKDAKLDKAAIWQISLLAISESNDFKYVMPIMIKALNGKIKNVSTEKTTITVLDKDET